MQTHQTEPRSVHLSGPLTLRDAEVTRERLLGALQDSRTVVVDLGDATEVDVSIIQLLIAARRSAAVRDGTLTLAAPAAGALLDALRAGGFFDPEHERATQDEAFWTCRST